MTGFGRMQAVDSLLVEELTSIVSAAAAAILEARTRPLDARCKPDLSPVTAADHAAEDVILQGLARVLPGVAVVSEEAAAEMPPATLRDTFILVDPLDGTRELLAGRDEFTVNVAIMSGGDPLLRMDWSGAAAKPAAPSDFGSRLGLRPVTSRSALSFVPAPALVRAWSRP